MHSMQIICTLPHVKKQALACPKITCTCLTKPRLASLYVQHLPHVKKQALTSMHTSTCEETKPSPKDQMHMSTKPRLACNTPLVLPYRLARSCILVQTNLPGAVSQQACFARCESRIPASHSFHLPVRCGQRYESSRHIRGYAHTIRSSAAFPYALSRDRDAHERTVTCNELAGSTRSIYVH